MKKLIGVLLVLVAAQAVAVNYDKDAVGNVAGGEGYYRYINNYSVKATDNTTKAWVIFDYQKEQADKTSGEKYLSSKVLYSFDCAAKKFSTPKHHLYKRDLAVGKVLSSSQLEAPYEDVVSGSENEEILNRVCKRNI